MKKTVHKSGKRKRAIARATLSPGKGIVRFNKLNIDHMHPEHHRLKLIEPLLLAPALLNKVNVNVVVRGGGQMGQIEAGRLAIGRALLEYSGKTSDLKKVFEEYDDTLLVADVRRKESNKPNDSKARAKRQKSYR